MTARDYVYFYRGNVWANYTAKVDSYNGLSGAYDPLLNRNDGGTVAADRIYTYYKNKAEIYGYLARGYGQYYSVGSGGRVYGIDTPSWVLIDDNRVAGDFKSSFPDMTAPSGGTVFNMGGSSLVELGSPGGPPESYIDYGDLRIYSGRTLRINGPVIMTVTDDFEVYGTLDIAPDGDFELYVRDDIKMSYSGRIVNRSPDSINPDPTNLKFYSTRTSNYKASFFLKGNPTLYATIYAPRGYIDFRGNGTSGTMHGAVVGDRIIVRGNYNIHYDEQVKILGASPEAFDIRLYELETKQASGN